MSRYSSLTARLSIGMAILLFAAIVPVNAETCPALPDARVALSGLQSVVLRISISSDAARIIKLNGGHEGKVAGELQDQVTKKLALVNLPCTLEKSDKSDATELLIDLDEDITEGALVAIMSLREPVTLLRAPNTKLRLTTWSDTQHPRSPAVDPIREVVIVELEKFLTDYLAANKK
jgi:hypothetical protein